jgi:hypothetical protein
MSYSLHGLEQVTDLGDDKPPVRRATAVHRFPDERRRLGRSDQPVHAGVLPLD